ncbi:TetR/AcrR family transcriptional regulator C-terminal domain-containing protein [Naasia lichenicola]|uniref:GntR family transcriptional regulator n=1 Tax=Naasia lichenicola TaxID=2565933 RepID=A0A4S4FNJ0_9MICO|nr:GntR family transcriptional regulator [Naasia lichenicola]THG31811.1 GntR family transcriptional regulator [Naasia lichenicola]
MSDQLEPASVRIASELRRRIASGQLTPGGRMPSTRAIMQRYGVAMATATKVLALLRAEGLIESIPGIGTVVADRVADRAQDSGAGPDRSGSPRRNGAPLSAQTIVAAGLLVADGEGIAALSMRRVATELDTAPMSLYRHVRDKDQLLLGMMDAAMSEVTLPDPPASWRDGLEIAATALWTTFRRHPWLPSAISVTRPQLLPGALEYSEWVLGVLEGSEMDATTMFTTHLTLFTFVRGVAMNLEAEYEDEAASGVTGDAYISEQESAIADLVADGKHPHFAGILQRMNFDLDLDELFRFGLHRLLSGIEASTQTAAGTATDTAAGKRERG